MKELPNIGKPARRALTSVGLTHLDTLSQVSAKSLAKLHGVGPKAIARLETALADARLSFGPDLALDFEIDFLAMGDLGCDNAPKRRLIRDFLLSAWMQNATTSSQYLAEDAQLTLAGQEESLQGLDQILSAYQVTAPISSVVLHQILSHGKEGAAHASLTLNSGQAIHLAEFYQFEGHRKEAKLIKITRYLQTHSSK